jgi:hypothetical protein
MVTQTINVTPVSIGVMSSNIICVSVINLAHLKDLMGSFVNCFGYLHHLCCKAPCQTPWFDFYLSTESSGNAPNGPGAIPSTHLLGGKGSLACAS